MMVHKKWIHSYFYTFELYRFAMKIWTILGTKPGHLYHILCSVEQSSVHFLFLGSFTYEDDANTYSAEATQNLILSLFYGKEGKTQ